MAAARVGDDGLPVGGLLEGIELTTRIVFGAGAVARVAELAAELIEDERESAARVLLVTDAGLVAVGHAGRVETLLGDAGFVCERFDDVHENPTSSDVEACAVRARAFEPSVLVALGGGSSIDVAKGCAFVLAGGGCMEDYWGVGKGKGEFLPLLAIPTTAGTGSEVQSFALIGRDDDHQKMACGDARAAPRIAILDPELTLTLPRDVTICTGLDTIGHAVETLVTKARGPVSALFAREAFVRANRALPRILEDPSDLAARSDMLLAAAWGGIAIEQSMLGAAHSMANPLTARHEITHGLAVGLMLPHVVRFNAADQDVAELYRELSIAAGISSPESGAAKAVEALAQRLEQIVDVAGVPRRLDAHGVQVEAVGALAAEAARQWTAQFNPRSVGDAEFRVLFETACGVAS